MFIHLRSIYLSISLSIYNLSVYLSIFLSNHLSSYHFMQSSILLNYISIHPFISPYSSFSPSTSPSPQLQPPQPFPYLSFFNSSMRISLQNLCRSLIRHVALQQRPRIQIRFLYNAPPPPPPSLHFQENPMFCGREGATPRYNNN